MTQAAGRHLDAQDAAFGGSIGGEVPAARVLAWIDRPGPPGTAGVTRCDTAGTANPALVGHDVPGAVLEAGRWNRRHPLPPGVAA